MAPDGATLAVSQKNDEIKIFDVISGEERASHHGRWGEVYRLAFSPDGKKLAFGLQQRRAEIWEPVTGEEQTFAHNSAVEGVAFSPDGKTLVTAGQDRTCKFWDVITGQERNTFKQHSPDRHSLAISPDGTMIANAIITSQGKRIVLRRASMDPEARAFQTESSPDSHRPASQKPQ